MMIKVVGQSVTGLNYNQNIVCLISRAGGACGVSKLVITVLILVITAVRYYRVGPRNSSNFIQ